MSLTVTAAQSGTGTYDGIGLAVKAVTGASGAGATVTSATVTTPELSITPQATGSWVYGALANNDAAATYTAASNTTFSLNDYWSGDTYGFGCFRSTATTTADSAVTLGATAPTASDGDLQIALVEILAAAGQELAEDPSSPATVYTTTATSAATASFSPPAGALLVAMVSSDCTGTSGQSMTMTVTGGGLTWTEQAYAVYTNGSSTFQVVSVWTALVPPVPAAGGAGIPPRPFTPMTFRHLAPSVPEPPVAYITGTDTGTGADTGLDASAAVADTETGTGADTGMITATGTDTGTGADTGLEPSAQVTGTEAGTGTDAGEQIAFTATDTGAGADTATAVLGASGSDTGTGTDTTSITATAPATADAGSGTDTSSITAQITSADTGSGADTATIGVTSAETGTAAETAGQELYIRPPLVLWRAPDKLNQSGGTMGGTGA